MNSNLQLLALVPALVLACGSARSSSPGDAPSAGSGGASDNDASSGGPARAGAGSDGQTHYGLISITPSGPGGATLIQALFNAASPTDPTSTLDSMGDCSISTLPDAIDSPTPILVSAGTLTITGGHETITLAPTLSSAGVAYTASGFTLAGQQIFAGNQLTVQGSGDVVPEFSLIAGVPESFTLIEPDLLQGTSRLVLSRSSDTTLRWSGGGDFGVFRFAVNRDENGTTTGLGCRFPLAAGSGVIPAALVSEFSPMGAAPALSLFVEVVSEQSVQVGDWSITAQVTPGFGLSTGATVQIVDEPPTSMAPPAAMACPAGADSACTSLTDGKFLLAQSCSTGTAPTMAGGSIVPGTYVLTSDVAYFAANTAFPDACTTLSTHQLSRTLFVGDGCLSTVASDDQGHAANQAATFSLSGDTLTSVETCPSAHAPQAFRYTATPTSLILLASNSAGDSEVQTYLLE